MNITTAHTICRLIACFVLSACVTSTTLCANTPSGMGMGQNLTQSLTIMITGAVLFYWMVIRPEATKRKALDQARSALKKGDRVIAMGIIGQVKSVGEDEVILKMHDGSAIAVKPYMITEVQE